jgi:O-antigen/teichoic acid export membrane protein
MAGSSISVEIAEVYPVDYRKVSKKTLLKALLAALIIAVIMGLCVKIFGVWVSFIVYPLGVGGYVAWLRHKIALEDSSVKSGKDGE